MRPVLAKKSHGKGTHRRTLQLLDRIGPVGRFDEKLVSTMELLQHIAQEHSINKETTELQDPKEVMLTKKKEDDKEKDKSFHPSNGYSLTIVILMVLILNQNKPTCGSLYPASRSSLKYISST